MILKNVFQNIEFIVVRFKEIEEEESISAFLESLINLCIQTNKIEYIDVIFKVNKS